MNNTHVNNKKCCNIDTKKVIFLEAQFSTKTPNVDLNKKKDK